MAMPPPMVPAPTTAARAIAWVGVSFGTSGILPASRSAKNRCRIAFDSTDRTQSANSSISRREPLSKSMMRQASMASTAANGARAHRAPSWRALRAQPGRRRCPRAIADLVLQIQVRRRSFAAARASRRRWRLPANRRRSRRRRCPRRQPGWQRAAWPPVHISSAAAGPHKRGSRWRAACAGMIPVHLGLTTLAVRTATR